MKNIKSYIIIVLFIVLFIILFFNNRKYNELNDKYRILNIENKIYKKDLDSIYKLNINMKEDILLLNSEKDSLNNELVKSERRRRILQNNFNKYKISNNITEATNNLRKNLNEDSVLNIIDYPKYIEIISEVEDSMILITKINADSINKKYFEWEILDSLNIVNCDIIDILSNKDLINSEIIDSQNTIIYNDSIVIERLITELDGRDSIINYSEKLLKKERRRKIFWKSTTGAVSVVLLTVLLL